MIGNLRQRFNGLVSLRVNMNSHSTGKCTVYVLHFCFNIIIIVNDS